MLIVADTSPPNYLILIQIEHVLPQLYGRIIIPPQVLLELQSSDAPLLIRTWAATIPTWIEIITPAHIDESLPLDAGEAAAIALVMELKADRLLIDEQDGRAIAGQMGIPIAGTLAVLRDAALAGLIDLKKAFDILKKMSFRASPRLFDQVLREFQNKQ